MRFAPGDPALLMAGGSGIPPKQIEAIREAYGINRPILVQFAQYMRGFFRGDLGDSFRGHMTVTSLLAYAIPYSLILGPAVWVFSTVVSFFLGLAAATHRNSAIDLVVIGIAGVGRGLPEFWFGILLMLIFSVQLGWLPSFGSGTFAHILLPLMTMSVQLVSLMTRVTRDAVLDVIQMDYVRTAYAKGLKDSFVLWKHVVRNALIPVVTVMGLRLGALLGAGMVVTETIFNWPGVGNLLLRSILAQDYPTIQGCMIVIASAFLIVNLVVDLLYVLINPKIQYS